MIFAIKHVLTTIAEYSVKPRLKRTTQKQLSNKPSDIDASRALFIEITEILGADTVIPDQSPSGFLFPLETPHSEGGLNDQPACTEDAQMGNMGDLDVSRVVGEINDIVRAENDSSTLEERLENLSYGLNSEVFDMVLKSAGKREIAMEFYNQMIWKDMVLDVTLYNMVMNCMARSGDVAAVNLLGNDMIRLPVMPENCVHGCMLKIFCIFGRIEDALELIRDLKNKDLDLEPENYKNLVRRLCKAGRITYALEIVDIMKRRDMDDGRVHGIVINGYLGRNDADRALEVFQCMKESGCVPTISTYTDLIQHLFRLNRYEETCMLYDEMLGKGIKPDIMAITTMVEGHVSQNRISGAWKILERLNMGTSAGKAKVVGTVMGIGGAMMLTFYKNIEIHIWSTHVNLMPNIIKPHNVTRFVFIRASYHKYLDFKEDTLLYIIAIDGLFLLDFFHNYLNEEVSGSFMTRLQDQVQLSGVKLTKDVIIRDIIMVENQIPTYILVRILVLESSKPADSVLEFLGSMLLSFCKKHSPLKVTHIPTGSEAVSKDDNVKVLLEMQASKIKIQDKLFGLVITYMENKGELTMHKASTLDLEKFKESDKEVSFRIEVEEGVKFDQSKLEIDYSSIHPNLKSYNNQDVNEMCRILSSSTHRSLIQENLEKSTIQFSRELVIGILQSCNMHESYNMAIKIARCNKDFKHVRSLFFEMRRNSYSITTETWTIMIMLYGRTSLTEMAMNCFKEMKVDGYSPSRSTYKYLIIAFCGRKGMQVDDAIKIYDEIISSGHSGRVEEALALLEEVGEEKSIIDQLTCGSIVHGLLRKGQLEEALAKEDAMKPKGITPTIHKQVEKAIETFEEMIHSGYEPTIVTYFALIGGYMKVGRPFDAWNILYRMKLKGPFPDFKTYSMFLTCLCKAGRSEEGMRLISEMLDGGIVPSRVLLGALGILLVHPTIKGNFKNAPKCFLPFKLLFLR
ncbi:putative pentatricopeptide repeat-containing protein, mitochondrial [Glycine soja]